MTLTPSRSSRGITLIESVVVVALISLLMAGAAPSMSAYLQTRRLEGVSQQLQTDLHWLRNESIARQQALRLTVFSPAAGSCWLIHSGDARSCTCNPNAPEAEAASCTGDALLLRQALFPTDGSVSVRANVASLRVDPRLGTFSPTGSVDLNTTSGQQLRHVVNILGRVRLCSTNRTAGWPTC